MNAPEGRGDVAGTKALSVVIAALLAACGGLIQGFDTGGISNASASIVKQFHLTSGLQGVVTSMVLVGAMIGSAAGGLLADKYGRRKMLIVCGATFCAGVLIEIFSSGLWGLLLGRVIAGLSIGIASCVSTLYISEISPPARRGGLLSFFQLAVTVGIVCGILIALVAGQHPWTWRILLGAGLLPGLILFFGMLAMPETPAWLHHDGQEQLARAALSCLRPHDQVETEFQALEASTDAAHSRKSGSSAFSSPALRLALVAGVGMALIQHRLLLKVFSVRLNLRGTWPFLYLGGIERDRPTLDQSRSAEVSATGEKSASVDRFAHYRAFLTMPWHR